MPMVALTNKASMCCIAGARCTMSCPKVMSKLKFVVQATTEGDALPHNGLGLATMLDMPFPWDTRMVGLVSMVVQLVSVPEEWEQHWLMDEHGKWVVSLYPPPSGWQSL